MSSGTISTSTDQAAASKCKALLTTALHCKLDHTGGRILPNERSSEVEWAAFDIDATAPRTGRLEWWKLAILECGTPKVTPTLRTFGRSWCHSGSREILRFHLSTSSCDRSQCRVASRIYTSDATCEASSANDVRDTSHTRRLINSTTHHSPTAGHTTAQRASTAFHLGSPRWFASRPGTTAVKARRDYT